MSAERSIPTTPGHPPVRATRAVPAASARKPIRAQRPVALGETATAAATFAKTEAAYAAKDTNTGDAMNVAEGQGSTAPAAAGPAMPGPAALPPHAIPDPELSHAVPPPPAAADVDPPTGPESDRVGSNSGRNTG
ncbi:hypothetical protein O159_27590 [Leifsonia xyli subsp. cynodontis DSM 46306]|jgi:hypothetical protein|uniref:Uncharacterized protein n=2 Tax=Leifsonia xyli TaxID=1575 RepID=U3PAS6_LEIXC|nr:hypothetical protein O159_27590 [Leifsonia xyli subsp. cynodontis DSM 46306]